MTAPDPRLPIVAKALEDYVKCDGLGCGCTPDEVIIGYRDGWTNFAADPEKVAALVLKALDEAQ